VLEVVRAASLGRHLVPSCSGQDDNPPTERPAFASHFIQNGGNILTLQKNLGHSSLAMTMRYAHLAPDHLQDAVRYSPLNNSLII
jgi:site-specific recombinase XerD